MGNVKEGRGAKAKKERESGVLADQPCWSFIKEMNSASEERLESVAIRDGYRAYTYRQMFRQWERYAEAFTGVGISGENQSRVALIGTPTAEAVFAIYGLNMAGASVSQIYPVDLFEEVQITGMIEKEGITDLVVSEVWAFPKLMRRLLRDRESLGLRNIIVLESPMGGDFAIPVLEVVRKLNAVLFRDLDGGLMMEDLLKEHEATPLARGGQESADGSFILHTTGTVNGTHKPVPLSDKAVNSFVLTALKAKDTYPDFKDVPEHMVICYTLNSSWVYAFVDMLHMPLGLGMELVCLPWGGTNPRYGEAVEHYGFNILCTSMNILDFWLKTLPVMDLSALKVVFMGGTYVSPEYKQKFNDYLSDCGSTARVINGYGLSELGGACILSPSDRDDDAIGFPLPGYKVKIFDEDEEVYYDLEDGPRTGILLLSSDTMSSGKLDDKVFFELTDIDGVDYFNTNDKVRVNEDGSLTCIGRSNQLFINNAGIRFDAGLVQTAITAQPGVVACGIVPEFHKVLHDNVPILYAEMSKTGPAALKDMHQALVEVFIKDDALADSNMPSQVVIVEKIPLNTGGKVDTKRLSSGGVTGQRFSVRSVKGLDGRIADVLLIPSNGEDLLMDAGVPEELENDPYNIIAELFAVIPDIDAGNYAKLLRVPGFRELVQRLTGFDIRNISGSVLSMTPKMLDIAFRKYLLPIMKGEEKMSKKKTKKAAFPMFPGMAFPVPPAPAWGWDWDDWDWDDWDWGWGWTSSDVKSNWEKAIDAQKSSIDGAKDQYEQFFKNFTDMMDNFAESMPEDLEWPWMPSWGKTPKEFRETAKEWEAMANDYFVEKADLWNDFMIKSKEKACEQIPETAEEVEEDDEVIEVKAEAKPAKAAKKEEAAPAKKETKTATAAKETKSAQ